MCLASPPATVPKTCTLLSDGLCFLLPAAVLRHLVCGHLPEPINAPDYRTTIPRQCKAVWLAASEGTRILGSGSLRGEGSTILQVTECAVEACFKFGRPLPDHVRIRSKVVKLFRTRQEPGTIAYVREIRFNEGSVGIRQAS